MERLDMKYRFAFHKPLGERGVGKLIVGYTWLLGLFYNWKALKYNYSHEEAWFPDKNGNFIFPLKPYQSCEHMGCLAHTTHPCESCGRIAGRPYVGECFSSTTRGDAEGVRFAPASEVLKHPERWDYIEIEVDDDRFEVAYAEAKRLDGLKYDYGYILDFLWPFTMFQKEKRWACSEICDWLKVLLRVWSHQHKRISPRRAAMILAKEYGEPRPLM